MERNIKKKTNSMNIEKDFYFLDTSDEGFYFIKDKDGDVFTAGNDYEKVCDVIEKLNKAPQPIIIQNKRNSIQVCWDSSDGEKNCKFEQAI